MLFLCALVFAGGSLCEDASQSGSYYSFSISRHVEVFSQRTVEIEEIDDKTGKKDKKKKTLDPEFIGSGVFIQPGKVLTARHVVEAEDWDGNKFTVKYVRYPESYTGKGVEKWKNVPVKNTRVSDVSDLAILYLEENVGSNTEVGEDPDIGEEVFNAGSPFASVVFSTGYVHSYTYISYSSSRFIFGVYFVANYHTYQSKIGFRFLAMGTNLVTAPGSSGSGIYKNFKLVGIHVAGTMSYSAFGYAVRASEIKAFLK